MNKFAELAALIIARRCAQEHDARCYHGDRCRDREWHIRNDYLPRIRREVQAEMRAAAVIVA